MTGKKCVCFLVIAKGVCKKSQREQESSRKERGLSKAENKKINPSRGVFLTLAPPPTSKTRPSHTHTNPMSVDTPAPIDWRDLPDDLTLAILELTDAPTRQHVAPLVRGK